MFEILSVVMTHEAVGFSLQILLAALLGGLIGLERELSDKPAGLRTNILICVGAMLFTVISTHFTGEIFDIIVQADQARIASQIVSGIGFLGAGTIIQSRGNVQGLTTAATLWVVAAIGTAIGLGLDFWATLTTFFVLLVLVPLNYLENKLMHQSGYWFNLKVKDDIDLLERLETIINQVGVRAKRTQLDRSNSDNTLTVCYDSTGPKYLFNQLQEEIIKLPDVKTFHINKY